jgi:hypothetical protein
MAKETKEKAETIPEPQAALAPPPGSFQSVPLDAWVRQKFGAKHIDQGAGFMHWAGKNGHTRNSSAGWEELFQAFNTKKAG